MKNFKTFLGTIPSQTAILVFGRMNPITAGHGLVIERAKLLAKEHNSNHYIYLSHSVDKKKNPLSEDKKLYWARKLFPTTNFVESDARTFIDAAKELNKKHKHLIMVCGSDRVEAYQEKLNKYNGQEFRFESIKVVSAGNRDSNSASIAGISGSLLREYACNGNLDDFKKSIPVLLEADARRYMNDVRIGMGFDAVKDNILFDKNYLREKYRSGNLVNIGDIVESEGSKFEVVSLGTNYISVVKDGEITRKWLSEVKTTNDSNIFDDNIITENVINYKGYRTKNFTTEIATAFYPLITESNKDVVAILKAIKSTDNYLDKNNNMITFLEYFEKAENYLTKLEVIDEHKYMQDYEKLVEALSDKTIKSNDTLKVARIIGTFLSVDNAEAMSSPALIVNAGLRNVKKMQQTKETKKIVSRILAMAKTAGIEYDEKLVPSAIQEAKDETVEEPLKPEVVEKPLIIPDDEHPFPETIRHMKKKHKLGEEEDIDDDDDEKAHFKQGVDSEDDEHDDVSDDELDAMIKDIDDWDDIIDVYDDDELEYVDPETGETIDDDEFEGVDESVLSEVLSRQERIRAKMRMRKSKSKRVRGAKLALKRFSSSTVINKRARRLAVNLMKKKLTQGRDSKSLSVGEKERVERMLQKRKSVINRIAMKLTAKVRKIEKNRMSSHRTAN